MSASERPGSVSRELGLAGHFSRCLTSGSPAVMVCCRLSLGRVCLNTPGAGGHREKPLLATAVLSVLDSDCAAPRLWINASGPAVRTCRSPHSPWGRAAAVLRPETPPHSGTKCVCLVAV